MKGTILSILFILQILTLISCQSSDRDKEYFIYSDNELIKDLVEYNEESLENYPEEINDTIVKYIERIKNKKYELKKIKVSYRVYSILDESPSTIYVDSSKYKVYTTLKPLNGSKNLYYYFLLDQNFNIIDTMENFNGDGQHPVEY